MNLFQDHTIRSERQCVAVTHFIILIIFNFLKELNECKIEEKWIHWMILLPVVNDQAPVRVSANQSLFMTYDFPPSLVRKSPVTENVAAT